jgi:ankyrin repeat protein
MINACWTPHVSIVQVLLETGPRVTATDAGWLTSPLFVTVYSPRCSVDEKKQIIRMIMAKGADINAKEEDGNTLLHAACGNVAESGEPTVFDPELVSFLLKSGANIHAVLKNGRTALHSLCAADLPSDENEDNECDSKDEELACEDEELVCEDEELACEDDELACEDEELACEDDELACEDDEYAGEGDELACEDDEYAGKIATKVLHCAKLLLEHGADANLRDADGRSPLELAQESGKSDVVDLLLAHKKNDTDEDKLMSF